jgi:uncharacterized protein YbaR (Trm112 family)
MDKRLLDILCCPATRVPVRLLNPSELDALNRAVRSGGVRNAGGAIVASPLEAGLITTDGRLVYRIEDDIPLMLVDEAIPTRQVEGFPSGR